MDTIVRNARIRGKSKLLDIGIENGKISEVAEKINAPSNKEIDAAGHLTTPAFIDPHIHL